MAAFRIPTDGGELHGTVRGSGPPCLVLSMLGTEVWETLLPAPIDRRHTVICVDLPGSGSSRGHPALLNFDTLTRDLEALRARLGIGPVTVLGYSILGVLALEYARRAPHGVSGVVLAGTPPFGDMTRLAEASSRFVAAHASAERKTLLAERLAALPSGASPAQHVAATAPLRFFDPRTDPAGLFARAVPAPALLGHILGTLVPGWDVRLDADRIRAPVFIALGRHDYTVPWDLWPEPAAALPDATLHIFERSGHQPFAEEPQQFAEAVAAWARTRS